MKRVRSSVRNCAQSRSGFEFGQPGRDQHAFVVALRCLEEAGPRVRGDRCRSQASRRHLGDVRGRGLLIVDKQNLRRALVNGIARPRKQFLVCRCCGWWMPSGAVHRSASSGGRGLLTRVINLQVR